MSDDQHKWPTSDFLAEDDQTPPRGTPAPPIPGHTPPPGGGNPQPGQFASGFGNPATGSFQAPTSAFGNPATGSFQAPTSGFGNPPTGQINTAHFGNPMTGQINTGQFANPTGQFVNPPTGQFANPPTGQFGNPPTGQFGSVGLGNPATGQFPVDRRTPSGQFPAQSRTGQFPGVGQPAVPNHPTGAFDAHTGHTGGVALTGQFDSPLVAPLATPPGMPAIRVVTTQMRIKYGGLGALFGLLVGVFLGILNSALEATSLVAGIPVTMQISGWFALLFGITCATKPERVANVLRSYGVID